MIKYSSVFAPGDWAMLWMVNNVADFKRISAAVLAGGTANDFNSGLKFIGRVNSIREILNTHQDGKKQFRYSLTLKSFSEFGTYVFYNPLLSDITGNDAANIARVLSEMSTQWSNIFQNTATGSDNISNIVSLLIQIFLGAGPLQQFKQIDGQVRSPNAAFLIPAPILTTLGLPTSRQENASGNKYSDMLHTLIGLQRYTQSPSNAPSYEQFIPSNYNQSIQDNQFLLTDPVPGTVINPPENFNNVTIWSLLAASMNSTLNEMYCTLRTSWKDGRIMPTFVLRQIIFSNDPNNLNNNGVENFKAYTPFLNLPRWKISDTYPLISYNLGTSDAGRFNFFVCKPANLERTGQPVADEANQYNNNNIYVDGLDIARNGLRTHFAMSTADVSKDGSALTDVVNWKNLVADYWINGQYKQSGSMVLAGIQAPIAIGDNIEFDGRVFHIEQIEHVYSVSPRGIKSFITILGLSHGITTDNKFVVEGPKLRYELTSVDLPGYTDEESYANETLIASTSSGRSVDLPFDPGSNAPDSTPTVSKQIEAGTANLKKNMGIA